MAPYTYRWLLANTRMYVATVNTLIEAIRRRATLIGMVEGVDYNLPIELVAGDKVRLDGWLDEARGAIEAILATNEYGRFTPVIAPPYPLQWTPWNKADLIAQIRTPNDPPPSFPFWTPQRWVGYVSGPGGDWRPKGPSERPYVGYINELISACELLVFLPVTTTHASTGGSTRSGVGTDADWHTALQLADIDWNTNAWSAPVPAPGGDSASAVYNGNEFSPPPHNATCDAGRGTFSVTIPALAYPVKECFLPWASHTQYWTLGYEPYASCVYDTIGFAGNLGVPVINSWGAVGPDYYFDGWMLFGQGNTLSWNNVVRDFSNECRILMPNGFSSWWSHWGALPADPPVSSAMASQYLSYDGIYARFEFDGYSVPSIYAPESAWVYPAV